MTYVIYVLADDSWIEQVDFEAHGPGAKYPTGRVSCTADPLQAIKFTSQSEARAFIERQSIVCPHRPDGKPNRPLRALTLAIVDLEENELP